MQDPSDRLDSWKAIAEYLHRDERTLRRWEKQGLPVRRVGTGPGHSVFAFKSEIDAWLRAATRPDTQADESSDQRSRAATLPKRAPLGWRVPAVVVALLLLAWRWQMVAPEATGQVVRASISQDGISAQDDRGAEVWRHRFPPELQTLLSESAAEPTVVVKAEPTGVYAMTSYVVRRTDGSQGGGALRLLAPDGRVLQSFSFDDRWTFSDGRTYEGPWALTDFRVDDRYGRHVAVAAHHLEWWPSLITMLDGQGRRLGTFVHSGWVETLRWIDGDRLAFGGFSNGQDGGVLGVLDARNLSGRSPEAADGAFHCIGCPNGHPLFYAVFPRSELNRLTGSGFNRAWVRFDNHTIIVRTSELDRPDNIGPLTDVIYTFSDDLRFLEARFSDRYWDRHRQLELEGRLTHTRAACPDRDGPPPIRVWTPGAGWHTAEPEGR